MSETTEETETTPTVTPNIVLTLGGQVITSSAKSISNQWQGCFNNNHLYIDSTAADNRDKAQFFLDPDNHQLLLGKAKLDVGTNQKFFNVYVKTALAEINQAAPEYIPPTIYPTNKISALGQGKGISLSYDESQDVQSIVISIDDTVVTRDQLQKNQENSNYLTKSEELELKGLLEFFRVQYSDKIENITDTLGNGASTSVGYIFAASFQYLNNSKFENKKFNCIRFTNPNNSTKNYGDVFCVIRQCKTSDWQKFRTDFDDLNLFIDNESDEIKNMDKFEFLYTNSEPIAFSINSVNQYSAKSGETLEWIFPTNFEIKEEVVYLITFQNDKSSYITSENTRLINIASSSESAPLSTFFRRYNRGSINSQNDSRHVIKFQLGYKQPLGVKFK